MSKIDIIASFHYIFLMLINYIEIDTLNEIKEHLCKIGLTEQIIKQLKQNGYTTTSNK